VINATGLTLNTAIQSAFYVAPIRNENKVNSLFYDIDTKEITYGPTFGEYYYAVASDVGQFGYSTNQTFVCSQVLTVVIPAGFTTFDIETNTSSMFSNVPTNNGGLAIVRFGTTSPTVGSTAVPAGTATLVPETDVGLNNVQSSTQSLISFKGDLHHLYINANTIITAGTTYYFSVWGRTITAVSIVYGYQSYMYIKVFRKS